MKSDDCPWPDLDLITMSQSLTYVSLFSSAGLGCYGFKQEGFECLASAELLSKRLEIQRANKVADSPESYFQADLSQTEKQDEITAHVKKTLGKRKLDVLIATPPCQGMSVANHKKNNELPRNSLVVASIKMVMDLKPQVFVFENVRAFLQATCLDLDGGTKTIESAILKNLSSDYVIKSKVMNLKDFGSPSSRTRTLVVGIRNTHLDIAPLDLFPSAKSAPTLRELIGHLPPLTKMGEISNKDIYHGYRKFDKRMLPWIKATKPQSSAFENKEPNLRPHQVIDGKIVENKAKNGDKYQRQNWEAVAPCVHTRNDILASQNTVHPRDHRVFSIRELMLMMGVPDSFRWTEKSEKELNNLTEIEKEAYLSANELTIRQCLGEGVPTPVFRDIAKNYKALKEAKYVHSSSESVSKLERENVRKKELSAFYTRRAPGAQLVTGLSKRVKNQSLKILEPSAGAGSFLSAIYSEFSSAKHVRLDLIEIDPVAVENLKKEISLNKPPVNFEVNVICENFLTHEFKEKYDFVIGNPPFGKSAIGKRENLFAQFLEKALQISQNVSFIIPKAFLMGADYRELRDSISSTKIHKIIDYGQAAFVDVRIETVGLDFETNGKPDLVDVISWILPLSRTIKQSYIIDKSFPLWLLYRNKFFDEVAAQLKFDVFESYRDRSITKAKTSSKGKLRLVRGSDIIANQTDINSVQYRVSSENVPNSTLRFLNSEIALVAPNLTYYVRAARLPRNSIADGSAAILVPKTKKKLDDLSIRFYSSELFFGFYRIAMNYSTRTLNIDRSSVFFWGLPNKNLQRKLSGDFYPGPQDVFKLFNLHV